MTIKENAEMQPKVYGVGTMLLAIELASNDASLEAIANATDATPEIVSGWLANEDLVRVAGLLRQATPDEKPLHVFVVRPEDGHDRCGEMTKQIKLLEMEGKRCPIVRLEQ